MEDDQGVLLGYEAAQGNLALVVLLAPRIELAQAEKQPKLIMDPLVSIIESQQRLLAQGELRVRFLNLSQAFAGSHAGHRPRNEQLRLGGDVLVKTVLPVLRPTVILVLGRTAWRQFRHGEVAQRIPLFRAARVNQGARKRRYVEEREVWRLKYEGGAAWMTWVYHPSWNVDHWEDRAGALRHLLELSVQA